MKSFFPKVSVQQSIDNGYALLEAFHYQRMCINQQEFLQNSDDISLIVSHFALCRDVLLWLFQCNILIIIEGELTGITILRFIAMETV